MAIAFRAVGTVKKNTGSGNMASIVLPTGHVTNDILICRVISADNVVSTMSAGWVKKLGVNSGTVARYEEWWKRDNGAEAAPTVTHTAGNDALAYIEAYSGVDSGLADPYRDAQTSTGTGAAATSFSITIPALTGVVSGDMLMATAMFGDANTSGTVSFTPPTGFTQNLAAQNNNAGSQEVAGQSSRLLATGSAGSTTSTANYSSGVAPLWVGAQSALSSATSGSAPDSNIGLLSLVGAGA